MNDTLQFSNSLLKGFCKTFAAQEQLLLLANYQLIPQMLCESIIDRDTLTIECTPEEISSACEQFYQRWILTTEHQQIWRSHYGLSQIQFEEMTTRLLQEKFGAWLQEQQLSDRDKAWLGIVKEIKRSMSLRKPENITMKVHKPFAFIQFN